MTISMEWMLDGDRRWVYGEKQGGVVRRPVAEVFWATPVPMLTGWYYAVGGRVLHAESRADAFDKAEAAVVQGEGRQATASAASMISGAL